MKKVLFSLFAVTALAVVPASFAQRAAKAPDADKAETPASAEARPGRPARPVNPMDRIRENFEKSKNENGDIQIEKAADLMAEDLVKGLKDADADGNGVVTKEELESARPFGRPGPGGPRGPRRGERGPFPPFGPMGVVFTAVEKVRTEDGAEIQLDELTAAVRQAQIEFFQTADSNGDGLLTEEEMKAFAPPMPPQGPNGMPPAEEE